MVCPQCKTLATPWHKYLVGSNCLCRVRSEICFPTASFSFIVCICMCVCVCVCATFPNTRKQMANKTEKRKKVKHTPILRGEKNCVVFFGKIPWKTPIDLNDNTMLMNCYVTKRYYIKNKIHLNRNKTGSLTVNPCLSLQIYSYLGCTLRFRK